jgi:hypothetical protein
MVRICAGIGLSPYASSMSAHAMDASLTAPKILALEGGVNPLFAAATSALSMRFSSASWLPS